MKDDSSLKGSGKSSCNKMSARDNPNRNRVFIGRLNPEARSRDLEKFFRDNGFSRLKDVNIKLGYAFVVRYFVAS